MNTLRHTVSLLVITTLITLLVLTIVGKKERVVQ
jgi:hypothetical protein